MDTWDILGKRARLTPHREALLESETGRRFTYRELNQRAIGMANFLLRMGVQEGDRVSILAHNSVIYLDLFFGVAKIGAIFAPLNWRLVANELIYIVNDCQPKILFCGPDFNAKLAEMRTAIGVEHVVSLEDADIANAVSYEESLAAVSPVEPVRPAGVDGRSAHCILYTSGTTGRPKGAIVPRRQVLWNCINTAVSWGLSENDVSPVFTPLFHAGGLFAFLTPLFYLGGRIVLSKSFDAEQSLRIIEEERCTVVLGVPTLFQMWLDTPGFAERDFNHIHFFISGGAPCPAPLMQRWREQTGTIFRQGYGLSEVGPNCFSMTDEESVPKSGSVGRPIFHSEMRLVDEEGHEVPKGSTGELLIRGPHVCAGYWNNPQASTAAIVDGWFHTGDMARCDEDGFYTIVGRFKDMIISGGENVYAAEVEAVFLEHEAVQECALIGLPDEKWGEVGALVTVLRSGYQVTAAALQKHGYTQLARYKVPKTIIFSDALPYSPYGKVEKVKLRRQYGG